MSQRNVEDDEMLDALWCLVEKWRREGNEPWAGAHPTSLRHADELERTLLGEESDESA